MKKKKKNNKKKKISINEYSTRDQVVESLKSYNNDEYHQKNAFKNCADKFKSDKEIISLAINLDPHNLKYVDEESKNDIKIVQPAVYKDISCFKYVSNELKKNKQLILRAVNQYNFTSYNLNIFLQNIDESLRNNHKIALAILRTEIKHFNKLPEELKLNKNFVKKALIQSSSKIFQYLHKDLKKDKKIIRLAFAQIDFLKAEGKMWEIDPHPYFYLYKSEKENRDLAIDFLKNVTRLSNGPNLLNNISTALNSIGDDYETIKEILSVNGHIIENLEYKYKSDQKLILTAVKNYPEAIFSVDHKFFENREILLASVQFQSKFSKKYYEYKTPLIYASRELLKDREICLAAVKSNPKALLYADPKFRDDDDIIWSAIKSYDESFRSRPDWEWDEIYSIYEYVDEFHPLKLANERFLKNKDFALAAVKVESTCLKFLDSNLRNDRDIILNILEPLDTKIHREGTYQFIDNFSEYDFKNDKTCVLKILNDLPYYNLEEMYDWETLYYTFEPDFYIGKTLLCDDEILNTLITFVYKHEFDFYYLLENEYFSECHSRLEYLNYLNMDFEGRVADFFDCMTWEDDLFFKELENSYGEGIEYIKNNYFYRYYDDYYEEDYYDDYGEIDEFAFEASSFLFYTKEKAIWKKDPDRLLVHYQFNSQDKDRFMKLMESRALHPRIQEGFPPSIILSAEPNSSEKSS